MKKRHKLKKHQSLKAFDIASYERHNNGLYRHKIIPNKKKSFILKRKKVDIRDYQPFFLASKTIFSFFLIYHYKIRCFLLI